MGRKVQIGQLFDGNDRKILTAYPRLFDDNEILRSSLTGDSYQVRLSSRMKSKKNLSF